MKKAKIICSACLCLLLIFGVVFSVGATTLSLNISKADTQKSVGNIWANRVFFSATNAKTSEGKLEAYVIYNTATGGAAGTWIKEKTMSLNYDGYAKSEYSFRFNNKVSWGYVLVGNKLCTGTGSYRDAN